MYLLVPASVSHSLLQSSSSPPLIFVHHSPHPSPSPGDVITSINGTPPQPHASVRDIVALIAASSVPCTLTRSRPDPLPLTLAQTISDPRRLFFFNRFLAQNAATIVSSAIAYMNAYDDHQRFVPFMTLRQAATNTQQRQTRYFTPGLQRGIVNLISFDTTFHDDAFHEGTLSELLTLELADRFSTFTFSSQYALMTAATGSVPPLDLADPAEVLASPEFLAFLVSSPLLSDAHDRFRVASLAAKGTFVVAVELLLSTLPSLKNFTHLRGPFLIKALQLEVLAESYIPFLTRERPSSVAELPELLPARITLHRPTKAPPSPRASTITIVTAFVFNTCASYTGSVVNGCSLSLPPSFPLFVAPQLNPSADQIVDLVIPDVSLPSGRWCGASRYVHLSGGDTGVLTVLATNDCVNRARKALLEAGSVEEEELREEERSKALAVRLDALVKANKGVEHSPVSFAILATMSIKSIASLVCVMLFEEKVFIVGERNETTRLIEALRILIAPLVYPHIIIPFTPPALLEGLATIPVPAVLGVENKTYVLDSEEIDGVLYYMGRDIVIGAQGGGAEPSLSQDIKLAVEQHPAGAGARGEERVESIVAAVRDYIGTLLRDVDAACVKYEGGVLFDDQFFGRVRGARGKRELAVARTQSISHYISER